MKKNFINPKQRVETFYPQRDEIGTKCGFITYKMSRACADSYLKGKKVPNQAKFLCDIVNEHFGLLGYCVSVIVE